MPNIALNLNQIHDSINAVKGMVQVELIAVSKTFPQQLIQEAYACGQCKFGESYPQELATKAQELIDLNIEWHFIGNIQSNKTRLIAQYSSWVHTITQFQHAKRLNDQRPIDMPPLQVLIEVNLSQESTKSGVNNLDEIIQLATEISSLPKLKLRGLMGMTSNSSDQQLVKTQFQQLTTYLKQLQAHDFDQLDQLSMGMSQDYPLAIEAGATLVRIGSNIFGARTYDN